MSNWPRNRLLLALPSTDLAQLMPEFQQIRCEREQVLMDDESFTMLLTRRSRAGSSDSDHKAAVHAKNTGGNDNVRLVRVLPGRAGSGTVISLAKSGNEAISTACDLLDE